jgi:hypothetical protein
MTSPTIFEIEAAVLEEASHRPAVALMRLSLEIDRQLRLILASIGELGRYQGQSPIEVLDTIAKSMDEPSAFPQSLRATVDNFWTLRTELVHARPHPHLIERAIDYGLRILRMLNSVPRRQYIVERDNLELFSDAEGKKPLSDVHGVIIKTVGLKGNIEGFRVWPTTKQYTPAQSVSWEWNVADGWDETWFLDSSGSIRPAFPEAPEFVGRPLDEI